MSEPKNTKSVRKFQCRDYLYDVFVKMSSELNCSVDYLINEAMREYLASRAASSGASVSEVVAAAEPAPQAIPTDATIPEFEVEIPEPEVEVAEPYTPAAADVSVDDTDIATSPPMSKPPPLPGRSSVSPTGRPDLFMIFNDEKTRIEKDEFIIGRGARAADLAIRDGNISRRHAAVVFQEGAYYIKDLGSTNGINFGDRRVESKRIEEGDVYRLCDYEIRFTYQ